MPVGRVRVGDEGGAGYRARRTLEPMNDRESVVFVLAAIVALGMMYVVSFVGLGPLDVACWLELTCPQ